MIVSLLDTSSSTGRDPLEVRIQPALDRMKLAERFLATWRNKGLCPRAVWSPHVEIQSSAGETLSHPVGCLPELIWLLRRETEDWTVMGRGGIVFKNSGGVA